MGSGGVSGGINDMRMSEHVRGHVHRQARGSGGGGPLEPHDHDGDVVEGALLECGLDQRLRKPSTIEK